MPTAANAQTVSALRGAGCNDRDEALELDARIERRPDKRRFYTLDGARGIAALSVLTVHWEHLLSPIVFAGDQRAVDLFFMMSGFVIALNYEQRLGSELSTSITVAFLVAF